MTFDYLTIWRLRSIVAATPVDFLVPIAPNRLIGLSLPCLYRAIGERRFFKCMKAFRKKHPTRSILQEASYKKHPKRSARSPNKSIISGDDSSALFPSLNELPWRLLLQISSSSSSSSSNSSPIDFGSWCIF